MTKCVMTFVNVKASVCVDMSRGLSQRNLFASGHIGR